MDNKDGDIGLNERWNNDKMPIAEFQTTLKKAESLQAYQNNKDKDIGLNKTWNNDNIPIAEFQTTLKEIESLQNYQTIEMRILVEILKEPQSSSQH